MSFLGTAIIGGSAITAGAGLIGDSMNGGQPQIKDVYTPGPNAGIEQSTAGNWADFLNSANAGNDYNAISPDWNDIWQQTQQQVQNYFSGTATNPGINDQINASFAQRGMSGDPAASFLQAQSGANEAQDLGNLSAQQNIAKQTFAQQGQQNWLNSMNEFQNAINPTAGNWSGAVVTPTSGQQIASTIGNVAAAGTTAAVGAANTNSQDAFLSSLVNGNGSGTGNQYAPSGNFAGGYTTPLSLTQ